MVVEPESLCWLTGRLVAARDGVTWAEEFARFPALEAVVRDDGSGLSKGIKLERARRRAAGLPASTTRSMSSTRSVKQRVPCGRPGVRPGVRWSVPRQPRRSSTGVVVRDNRARVMARL